MKISSELLVENARKVVGFFKEKEERVKSIDKKPTGDRVSINMSDRSLMIRSLQRDISDLQYNIMWNKERIRVIDNIDNGKFDFDGLKLGLLPKMIESLKGDPKRLKSFLDSIKQNITSLIEQDIAKININIENITKIIGKLPAKEVKDIRDVVGDIDLNMLKNISSINREALDRLQIK